MIDQVRRVARDPELAQEVFQEASAMQEADTHRLASERPFLQKQTLQRDEGLRRTAAAMAAGSQADVLVDRITEIKT